MTSRASLHGAWGRRWVTIGGCTPFETQFVVWLQAGPCYADIRVPFHADAVPRCFTGRSGWDGDQYRWTHELDLEGAESPAADDTGQLTFVDGGVIERGMFPTATGAVAYEEMWGAEAGSEGPWKAVVAPHGYLVRVGGHAITVVDSRHWGKGFAAVYRVLVAGNWTTRLALGDGDSLPAPDAPPAPDWQLVGAGDTNRPTEIPRLEQTWTP